MKQIQRKVQVPLATIEPCFFKFVHKTALWIAKYSDYKVEAIVLLFQAFIAYKNNGKQKFNAVLTKPPFAFPSTDNDPVPVCQDMRQWPLVKAQQWLGI